ncbi:MAG: cytochrome B6, partial [Proteobacteria bacterium]|nr:cytochrome B6 [Pseudomonadota bacterium]
MAKPTIFETIKESQAWKSIFRHGKPDNPRDQSLAI